MEGIPFEVTSNMHPYFYFVFAIRSTSILGSGMMQSEKPACCNNNDKSSFENSMIWHIVEGYHIPWAKNILLYHGDLSCDQE